MTMLPGGVEIGRDHHETPVVRLPRCQCFQVSGAFRTVLTPLYVKPVVIPDEAGIGQAPHSFAKAASERIRSGLSPKMISIWAAVWAPTPKPSKSLGAALVVRRVSCRPTVAGDPPG